MQIKLVPEANANAEYPCCYRTEYQGRDIFGIGKTWEQAKANCLVKVNAVVTAKLPEPEWVEIADDEMDTEFFAFEARIIDAGKV